jgi:hypothetical protein
MNIVYIVGLVLILLIFAFVIAKSLPAPNPPRAYMTPPKNKAE